MTSPLYEAFALRYASRPDNRRAETYFRFDLFGQPDAEIGMDYYFWVLRSSDHIVLVDCGFSEEAGAARKRYQDTSPIQLLAELDIAPADVDHVVLTHMHYDHVGNTDLFPGARFTLARPELEYWTGPHSDHLGVNWPVEQREIQRIVDLKNQGRLDVVEDDRVEIVPGISTHLLPGHTPGQLIVRASTPDADLLFTSDAVHYDEEMDLDLPFHTFSDLVGMLEGYKKVRDIASADPRIRVVPGHEPLVMDRFGRVSDNVVDLNRLVGAPAEVAS